jgi:hypothetical protein
MESVAAHPGMPHVVLRHALHITPSLAQFMQLNEPPEAGSGLAGAEETNRKK